MWEIGSMQWIFNSGCLTLDVECQILDVGFWIFNEVVSNLMLDV